MTITANDLRVQADSYRQTMGALQRAGAAPDTVARYLGWAEQNEQRAAAMDAEAAAERKRAAKAARAARKAVAVVEDDDPKGLWE